jgi:hypothetical protein
MRKQCEFPGCKYRNTNSVNVKYHYINAHLIKEFYYMDGLFMTHFAEESDAIKYRDIMFEIYPNFIKTSYINGIGWYCFHINFESRVISVIWLGDMAARLISLHKKLGKLEDALTSINEIIHNEED